MNRAITSCTKSSFFDCLSKCWVRMNQHTNIFCRCTIFHCNNCFSNHICSSWTYHMNTHISSVTASDNTFIKPSISSDALARPLALNGNLPDLYLILHHLILPRLSNRRHFGPSIYNPRNGIII